MGGVPIALSTTDTLARQGHPQRGRHAKEARLRIVKKFALAFILLLTLLALIVLGIVYWQGKRPPQGQPGYVALGSSYAAGPGLGERVPGSPFLCMRTADNYPRQLAHMRRLSLVDMTCSGSTAAHALRGGQYFQGPQIAPVTASTRLVTLTAGGNDLGLVSSLLKMSLRDRQTVLGAVMRAITAEDKPAGRQDYAALARTFDVLLFTVVRRAPHARVVVLTYPRILPPRGTCAALGVTSAQADRMRPVEVKLAKITRDAAHKAGVELLDLNRLGEYHHVCAREPWVSGARISTGTAMHPNMAGTRATARALDRLLSSPPSRS
jgi:hypothetical protein